MTRIAVLFLTLFLSVAGNAQNPFKQVATKLDKQDNFQSAALSRKTIQLYLKEKQPDSNTRLVLEQIDQLNVLQYATDQLKENQKVFDLVNSIYPLNSYTSLQHAQNGNHRKRIYIRENGNTISDLLLVECDGRFASLVEIRGNIQLDKIVLLKEILHFDGLKALENVPQRKRQPANTAQNNSHRYMANNTLPLWKPRQYGTPVSKQAHSQQQSNPYFGMANNTGIKVYDKHGNKMLEVAENPVVMVNGFNTGNDCRASFKEINPQCIQSIQVVNEETALALHGNQNGIIDIQLKGNCNEPFTICEGTLYFGQNGTLKSVPLHDDCSPKLLVDCIEKPLEEIEKLKPEKVRTIELTNNPRNCNGVHDGDYIILETK